MESPCSSLALFPWQQLWVVKSETEIPRSLQAASYGAGLTAPSATCWLNITSAADLNSDLTGSLARLRDQDQGLLHYQVTGCSPHPACPLTPPSPEAS